MKVSLVCKDSVAGTLLFRRAARRRPFWCDAEAEEEDAEVPVRPQSPKSRDMYLLRSLSAFLLLLSFFQVEAKLMGKGLGEYFFLS